MKFFRRSSEVSTISYSSAPSVQPNVQFVSAVSAPTSGAPQKTRPRRFAGASSGRLYGDWNPGTTTRNDKTRRSLKLMRFRSRQLVDDNEYAKKVIQLHQDNVIGAQGLSLTVLAKNDDMSLDIPANDAIKAAWDRWCKPKNCTVKRKRSWWHVQRAIARCEPQAGEVFIRMVKGFPNEFGFALQFLNPDCVDEDLEKRLENGNRIRMGIETNTWGETVAYWIRKENPYETTSWETKYERVPASDIIHKFMPLGEEDELRGVPWFHAPMKGMHMLESYEEAAMTAAYFGAANSGFFKKIPDVAGGGYKGDGEDENGNPTMEISPGQWIDLPEGVEPVPNDSPYPHELYAQFIKTRLRTLAAGVPGVNYNQLAGDYESVNYSSLRASYLESQDAFKAIQADFVEVVANVVFEEWLKMALLKGAIRINGKPLPPDKLEKFNQPKFVPRGFAWVDPDKETQAAERAVKNGFNSRSEIILSQGRDPDTVRAQFESDEKNDRDFNLNFDPDKVRNRAEVIGMLGRAGVLTPTQQDEEQIRYEFNLPKLPPGASKAWKEDGGARRPITLQSQEGFEKAQQAGGKPGATGAASPKKPED